MSHHGNQDSMDRFYAECDRERLPVAESKRIAATGAATWECTDCDSWLEANGYDCKGSRQRQRDRRAEQLDAELARLKAERDAL